MSGEKIGMVLQKHTIDEASPADINLMIDWAYGKYSLWTNNNEGFCLGYIAHINLDIWE